MPLVSAYETQPKGERRPEAHQKYVDIQYVISGEEVIGFGSLAKVSGVLEDCLAKRDVIFF